MSKQKRAELARRIRWARDSSRRLVRVWRPYRHHVEHTIRTKYGEYPADRFREAESSRVYWEYVARVHEIIIEAIDGFYHLTEDDIDLELQLTGRMIRFADRQTAKLTGAEVEEEREACARVADNYAAEMRGRYERDLWPVDQYRMRASERIAEEIRKGKRSALRGSGETSVHS